MEPLRDRLRRLLTLLLEALDDSGELELDAADARELAVASGFELEDLDQLQAWLHGQREPLELAAAAEPLVPGAERSDASVRLLSGFEAASLSVPAFGYLVELVHRGQISAAQMESLIQFAQLTGVGPLAPVDLEPLLDHVLFAQGRRQPPWQPGGDGRLH